jgi:DNA modification methylase
MQGSWYHHQYITHHADCFEIFPQLEKGKFRVIMVDLPYGKTMNHWDSVIPLEPMWNAILPLLSADGTIILFSQQNFTTQLIQSQPDLFRYELIWMKDKGTCFYEAEHRPLPIHENMLIFSILYPQLYHPIKVKGDPYVKKKNSEVQTNNYNKDVKAVITKNNGDRYPTSIFYYPRDFANCGIHPTQKPVALLQNLIESYSDPDDWVLDFCAGSMATIIAALLSKRNAVGIEKDAEIFDKASKRLQHFVNCGKDEYAENKTEQKPILKYQKLF